MRFGYFLLILFVGMSGVWSEPALYFENGLRILQLEGSPYERGHQHGMWLKEEIAANVALFLDHPYPDLDPIVERLRSFVDAQPDLQIPDYFFEELQGMSDATGVEVKRLMIYNLFTELFHCLAATLAESLTADGSLFHVRMLDGLAVAQIQKTAVLQLVYPNEGFPFVNVTYAGMIGCVTGMNAQKIVVSEVGGQGYGEWQGMPMAFLLRDILQYKDSLDGVLLFLSEMDRTCEYTYVFSDGKTDESIGLYATPTQFRVFQPGGRYGLLFSQNNTPDQRLFVNFESDESDFLIEIRDLQGATQALFYKPLSDMLIAVDEGASERYKIFLERCAALKGEIDHTRLFEIIAPPVRGVKTLHSVVFHPSTSTLWADSLEGPRSYVGPFFQEVPKEIYTGEDERIFEE